MFNNVNTNSLSKRLENFGVFCLNNKKVLNEFLKLDLPDQSRRRRPEKEIVDDNGLDLKLEDIVKYMPNLLDFDNKRAYFTKELRKRNVGAER